MGSHKQKLRAFAAAVMVTAAVVATTASGETDSSTASPGDTAENTTVDQGVGSADASGDIDGLELRDSAGVQTVAVSVTNRSEKRSDYAITVVAESADGATRYDETFVYVSGLEPGQSVTEESMFTDTVPADAKLSPIEVQRTASVGDQGLGSKDASGDVSAPQLVVDGPPEFASYYAEVTVTNNSEQRSDYAIEIVAESADGATRYDETFVYVSGLEPGQSTNERGIFAGDVPTDAALRASMVQRTAS